MSLPLPPDPYIALGIDPKADAATIKTAYKKLVLKCHPDKFPDEKLKAIKQDEFQRVQQAYEILGDDDKRQDYDLDVKAKRLREELMKQRSSSSSNGTPGRRYAHVNIRTAEPQGAAYAAPQPPQPPKGSYSPYSGGAPFAHSWEQQGRHSRTNSDDQRPHRARSYEKEERGESRDSRRRRDDEERSRVEKELAREQRRKQKAADEAAHLAALEKEEHRRQRREKRRQEEEMAAREEKERAKKRMERERADKKEKQDRLRRRESEDKRTKSRSFEPEPYVEDFGDQEEDIRRSSARKSSSKKRSNEPIREKSTGRADREQPLYESPKATTPLSTKLKEDLDIDIAKGYMASMRRNSSKASPLTTQYASDAYPDPDVAWHPPAHVTGSSRRHSGEGRHSKGDPVVINAEAEIKLDSRPSIVPLKKASTFAEPKTGGKSSSSARMPMPGHLQRAQTMQPEFIGRSSDAMPGSSSRHPYESTRQRKYSNIEVEELPDELEDLIKSSVNASSKNNNNNTGPPLVSRPRFPTSHSYRVRPDEDGIPRTSSKSTSSSSRRDESAYFDSGGSSNPFPKVRTAATPQQVYRSPSYAAEDAYYATYDHGHGSQRSHKVPVR